MKKILTLILGCFALASCVDTIILPDDKTVDEDYWKNSSDVSQMVYGAYSQLRSSAMQYRMIVWGGLRSDELVVNGTIKSGNAAFKDIHGLNIQTDNAYNDWVSLYSVINYCNIVLKKAPGVMSIDPNYLEGDNNVNMAEMKALRAFCYLNLIRVFRDVPMSLDAFMDSSQDLNLPQVAPSVVLDQVIKDLEEAWPTALRTENIKGQDAYSHMTKNAIWATLADAYLWRGSVMHDSLDYQRCVNYCDSIKESRKRNIRPGFGATGNADEDEWNLATYRNYYSNNFGQSANMQDMVFQVVFTTNPGLCELYNHIAKNNTEAHLTTSKVYATVAASEDAGIFYSKYDCRAAESIYAFGSGEASYVRKHVADDGLAYPSSFDATKNFQPRSAAPGYDNFRSHWPVYRLSDIMLMKAEALVQMGSHEREAFNLVRIVNARALTEGHKTDSLTWANYQSANKDALERLVLRERSRELCFEGKRWFDLLRYNYRHVDGVRYDQTLAQQGGNYVSNYVEMLNLMGRKFDGGGNGMVAKMPTEPYLYMPVFRKELEVNPNLVQNPVYSDNKDWQKDY